LCEGMENQKAGRRPGFSSFNTFVWGLIDEGDNSRLEYG